MKRALRKQIKQDELVSGWEQFEAWTLAHQGELRASALALVVLIVGGGALWFFQSQRQQASRASLEAALADFRAPVAEERGAAAEGSRTPEEKYRKALAGFDGVAQRYGSMDAGRRARYYASLCRVELGELEQAEKDLTALAAGEGDELVRALARVALAGLMRRRGAAVDAVEEYQKLLAQPERPLPEDELLFALGATLEEAGRLAEAADAYRRVVHQHPASSYVQEARSRSDYLKLAAKG